MSALRAARGPGSRRLRCALPAPPDPRGVRRVTFSAAPGPTERGDRPRRSRGAEGADHRRRCDAPPRTAGLPPAPFPPRGASPTLTSVEGETKAVPASPPAGMQTFFA